MNATTHLVLDGVPSENNFSPENTPPKRIRILAEQKIVGTGQYSEANLKTLISQLNNTYHPAHITLVDLRFESHFFISGQPVTLYGPKNQTNLGKTPEQITQEESAQVNSYLEKIKTGEKTVAIPRILKKTRGTIVETSAPEIIPLTSAFTEETLARQLGLSYQRFWVMDHHHPAPKTINHMVDFISTLPKDEWLIIHCRGGAGRTTTFMMLAIILRDTTHTSLETLMAKQVTLGGTNLLPSTEKQDATNDWLSDAKSARSDFLRHFYTYRWAKDGYGHQPFSAWLKKYPIQP